MMSEQLTGCHPPHLLLLHPSTASTPPQSFIVSLSGSLGESVLCVCVCSVRTLCVCVFVAADQRQLGGGGGRGGGGRWYLVPPPTSPPLCICPSQFEQRVFFFFACLPACLPLLLLSSSTHSLIQRERASKRKSKKERERGRGRYTAIPSQRARLFCYSGVNQVDAYCCRYRFVCVCVCVRVFTVGESGMVEFCFVVGDLRCVKPV